MMKGNVQDLNGILENDDSKPSKDGSSSVSATALTMKDIEQERRGLSNNELDQILRTKDEWIKIYRQGNEEEIEYLESYHAELENCKEVIPRLKVIDEGEPVFSALELDELDSMGTIEAFAARIRRLNPWLANKE